METELNNQPEPIRTDRTVGKLVRRENWRIFRNHIQESGAKSNITRYYPRRKWLLFTFFLKCFGLFMWLTRLSVSGAKKARELKLKEIEIEVPNLPSDFDGFRILHLTDLHIDRMKGIEDRIIRLLSKVSYDLVVMTGDYKDRMKMPASYYDLAFRKFGSGLKARHGIYATLGNHDSADLLPVIERNGIQVMINESVELHQGSSRITLTGVDDVHYFFSPEAIQALNEAPRNPCKILLVHSPELVQQAADKHFSLYLCGHTHAGQIATPNGKAIITHVNTGREFAVGRWRCKEMEGYTSAGAGVSGLTLRYFTQSEITVITLKKRSS